MKCLHHINTLPDKFGEEIDFFSNSDLLPMYHWLGTSRKVIYLRTNDRLYRRSELECIF